MADNKMADYELEHDVQNKIRIWCGEHDLLAIRMNVGLFRDLYTERVINAGPPNGWPDLLIIGYNGKSAYCECKTKRGYVRPDQKKMHEELRKRGFIVIIPKGYDDFLKKVEECGLLDILKNS